MDLEIDLNLNLDECNKEGDEREIDNIKDGEDGKILELYDGMEFDSYQKAYSCYLKYTKLTGFGIATRSSRRSKTYGEFIDVKFVCTRYELKQESNVANQHPYLKIDCKSMLHVKKKLGGKWHTICVLQSFGIFNIPLRYILKHWTKDAKSLYSTKNFLEGIESKKEHFDELYCQAIKLIEEGSLSEKSFSIAYHALKEALERNNVWRKAYGLQHVNELHPL
ncbi:hypothetical protein FEM48_Zijuj10G0168200 [Ziziphus jujuba var. spinosa]|uniref:Protein FAR1-RELATED SEQUENCE n=1 Tax=Ziziphus jujuba var. spinosa TaxID=714518 RepID=A0A978UPK0_ZIZJJ|nr:hypothetical protein FEM48_Zijuj10G0168200 [Ziziphus jujuba var. spinosa]